MSIPKAVVTLARALSYEPDVIQEAIRAAVQGCGGWEKLVRRGDRVLVKPNCLSPAPPDNPVQTHPAIILEVCRQLLDTGARPFVGDSPAWGSLPGNLRQLGILDELNRLGVPVVEFSNPVKADNPRGKVFKRLTVDAAALEADAIVNVPKFKTHRQLVMTVAIKNMFGCVNGRRKALWHVKIGGYENYFARMLVETYEMLRPVINIIDAVVAMEGLGPIKGTPRPLNLIMASTDGPAAERVAAEIIAVKPCTLRTLQAARELDVGTPHLDHIEVVGGDVRDFRVEDFQLPKLMPIGFSFPRWVKGTFKNAWIVHQQSRDTLSRID